MILVLDNYDSFTYNLVQYLGELGADLQVRRNDEVSIEQIRALKPERILVSPGPCSHCHGRRVCPTTLFAPLPLRACPFSAFAWGTNASATPSAPMSW